MENGIVHVRVDDRMIHGIVANYWIPYYKSTRCMVVNNEASENDVVRASLKMATPAGVSLSVLNVNKAITNINNFNYATQRVFLITRGIQQVYELYKGDVKFNSINLGNITLNEDPIYILDKTVRITEVEAEMLREMMSAGIEVYCRFTVEDSKKSISDLI